MILFIRLFMLVTFFCYAKGTFFNWRRITATSPGTEKVTAAETYFTSEKTSLENQSGTEVITGSKIPEISEKNSSDKESSTEIIIRSYQQSTAIPLQNDSSAETITASYLPSQTTSLENEFNTKIITSYRPNEIISLEIESTTGFAGIPETSFNPLLEISINPEDYETVTSIQEILTEIKSNEIIEQKIVKAMNEFSSNCNVYKPIILSIKNFTLAEEQKINIGKVTARFFNFHISELNEEHEEWKMYSTTIRCDSSQSADIIVSIPSKITTSADIEIMDLSNEVINRGSIKIILRGINILRQFFQEESNEVKEGVPYPEMELTFEKSEIALDIDMAYQLPIYRRLDAFFDTLKPLQEFYLNQLERKMEQQGISSSCSHILDLAENQSLTNLYVIDDVKFETYKKLSLSAGPILLEGLLNFDSTNFFMKIPDKSILRPNDIPEKKAIKQIKTKNLKGKFEWQYQGETNVLSFRIDHISFESIFTKRGVIDHGETADQESRTESTVDTDINIDVGKVEIEPSREKYCQNENHFANFILSGYLQSVIGDSLHNSIRNRLMSELTLGKCDNL